MASLLSILEGSRHRWVSIESLARRGAIPRDGHVGEAARLCELGFRVQQDADKGLRLAPHRGVLSAEAIRHELGTARVGRRVLVLATTSSTNDVAWEMSRQDDCDGAAVFTESQSAGRGRLGAAWVSGAGESVLLSVILAGTGRADPAGYYGRLNLAASVAVVDAIRSLTALRPRIKWPNDVLVDDKKVSGALIETRVVDSRPIGVLGIGINCLQDREGFPAALQSTAGSLRMAGEQADRLLLARRLLRHLDEWAEVVERGDDRLLIDAWRLHAAPLPDWIEVARNGEVFRGRTVAIVGIEGLVLDISPGDRRTFDARNTRIVRS